MTAYSESTGANLCPSGCTSFVATASIAFRAAAQELPSIPRPCVRCRW